MGMRWSIGMNHNTWKNETWEWYVQINWVMEDINRGYKGKTKV